MTFILIIIIIIIIILLGEPNKQTFVSDDIKLCCLITIRTGNNIYLFITKYSFLRLHSVSRKIFTYFQWGVETNLAKIQNHVAFDGFWSGLRLLTVTQQHVVGLRSHWATAGMLCLMNSPHFCLLAFTSFHTSLNFLRGGRRARLGPPGPGYPALSVGLIVALR